LLISAREQYLSGLACFGLHKITKRGFPLLEPQYGLIVPAIPLRFPLNRDFARWETDLRGLDGAALLGHRAAPIKRSTLACWPEGPFCQEVGADSTD